MKITADYREKGSGLIDLLEKEDIVIEIRKLSYGDYIINDSLTIERKTAKDFLVSIIDGRLFSQLSILKKSCSSPILLIEGNPYKTDGKMEAAAIKGALLSTQTIWYVPVIFSRSKEESRDLFMMIGRQDEKYMDVVPLRGGYRPKRLKSRQLYILQGLPKVGPTMAKRLLGHFHSVTKVMCAGVEELMEVDGMGKVSAAVIRKVLDTEMN